ncbi:hypothetical protein [Paraburkholderia elongata]|uniref:Uncharacterized protein n=1 Tax=Paraburkholderia elongata TaxID=2675747 RepID=A0A972NQU8_9BURK|nr:hypothetical protein [Paraburkholderia elongata]NPT58121.1 hypothetical protein [Paraburkholderia elongata]
MKLFRICNQDFNCLGEFEALDEKDALDAYARDTGGYQTYAEMEAADLYASGLDAGEYAHANRNTLPLRVREVDDRDYETLFVDSNGSRGDDLHGFRLARFVRAWYPTVTGADDCSLEDMLKRGSDGYEAIDFLLRLLGEARDEWVSENGGEPTFEQCCDELASWSLHYDCQYGARVIVWESGMREVRWGYGDKYCWADLDAVLEGVTLPDGQAPDWWDEDWTDYEYCDFRGQHFVKREDLPADDPRSPEYEDDEQEA